MPESPEESGAETPTPQEELFLDEGDNGETLNPQQILDNIVTSQVCF
jgi:hypothetical protein